MEGKTETVNAAAPRSRRNRVLGSAFAIVAAACSLAFIGGNQDDTLLKIYRGIDVFGKVYREVSLNYVDAIDPDRFINAGIDGMLETLDPYTVFIGEDESDEIDLVTDGKFGGIGITISIRNGQVFVVGLLEGFSAAKQGLQVGDRIIAIDSTAITVEKARMIRTLVRGAPGTEIRMTIEREGEPTLLEFFLVREEITVRNVSYVGYVEEGVGYIRLERFSRTAGDDLRNAIKTLMVQGSLKGLVLDLRDNPGGLLDMAVDVVSKFVPEGSLVVSTRGRAPNSERSYVSSETPMLHDVPMVVLVNGNSASASEIVAGAIQDLDRGVIVGTRTFGKGLVQTITRLSESTSLKITTARYYAPSGRSIQILDYVNHNRDGSPTLVPDTLRKEYRTRSSRPVYGGGGILPDSVVSEPPPSKLLESLNRQGLFLAFANRHAARTRSQPEPFEITDSVFAQFRGFLAEKEFTYEEPAEAQLAELRELASRDRYGEEFRSRLEQLAQVCQQEKTRAFTRFEDELREALKVEIAGRMVGEEGRIKASFAGDRQLASAIGILKNPSLYASILTP